MTITPIYAAMATLLFVFLSFRVFGVRRRDQISLGDGGNKGLGKRIRVHGNFSEYAPLALLLMALAEMQNASYWLLHLIGASLVIGRLIHAYGLGRTPQIIRFRVWGMILTMVSLIAGALANLGMAML